MKTSEIIKILKKGGVGVIPTDTIYGLVGQALNQDTVERIYKVRKRKPEKAFILLISSINDLKKFDIHLSKQEKNILEKIWPEKISVILDCPSDQFKYLHRGLKSLAFRMPKDKKLIKVLKATGALVAPSANWEGCEPAKNIKTAKKYFGDKIDFYVDAGETDSLPSTLIRLKNGQIELIRQGAVEIPHS